MSYIKIPRNEEAEQALLGSMMLSPASIADVIEGLSPDSFYDNKNKQVFSSIYNLFSKGDPIDMVTVSEEMRNSEENNVKISYIASLANSVPSSVRAGHYAKIVKDKYLRRKMMDTAERLRAGVQDDEVDSSHTMGEAISELTSSITNGGEDPTTGTAIDKLYGKIDEFVASGRTFYGAETGIKDLDYQLDGVQDGHFGIISGYTSVGKTSFMLNLLMAYLKAGKKVVFFSLEMSQSEIMLKLLSLMSGVKPFDIKRGKLPADSEHAEFLRKARLTVYTNSNWDRINMTMIKEAVGDKADVFFLDYIGLLQLSGGGSDYSNLAKVSKELQSNLQRFGIPMIALSQISNQQARDDNPNLISTKGAGDIAASADFVIRLKNKEEDNDILNEMKSQGIPLPVQCLVQKYRHGATGSLSLWFDIKTGKFLDKHNYDDSLYRDQLIELHGEGSEFEQQSGLEMF